MTKTSSIAMPSVHSSTETASIWIPEVGSQCSSLVTLLLLQDEVSIIIIFLLKLSERRKKKRKNE